MFLKCCVYIINRKPVKYLESRVKITFLRNEEHSFHEDFPCAILNNSDIIFNDIKNSHHRKKKKLRKKEFGKEVEKAKNA